MRTSGSGHWSVFSSKSLQPSCRLAPNVPAHRTFCDGQHFETNPASLTSDISEPAKGWLETKEKSMSSKSSELPTMRALLVGAALTGLIAGTTSAQASAAGASNPAATIAGQAATTSGEGVTAICGRAC